MNWDDLRILLAFERGKTLTGTSDECGLDVSTVYRRLRALESRLKTQLVDNVHGTLLLTPAGNQAARAAETMETSCDQFLKSINARDWLFKGKLRVALLDVFMDSCADAISDFRIKFPEIEIELLTSAWNSDNANSREADVAMQVSSNPNDTLIGRHVLHLEHAVFAHESLTQTYSKDWQRMPWIAYESEIVEPPIAQWMRTSGVGENIRVRVDTPLSLLQLAERGIGAAILAAPYAQKCKELVQVSDPIDAFSNDLWLITHPDLSRNVRVRAFVEHMSASIQDALVADSRQ